MEKERNKRRRLILGFPHRAVSSSGDTTGGIDNLRATGNAQEYLVSLYTRKLYVLKCNISNEAAILKLTQPYLPNAYLFSYCMGRIDNSITRVLQPRASIVFCDLREKLISVIFMSASCSVREL